MNALLSIRRMSKSALLPLSAMVVALLLGGLFLAFAGYNPFQAYRVMWEGAFGNLNNLAEVFLKATPLILIGGGLAVAFRCNIWNIGAEGQFYAGAVSATGIGIAFAKFPGFILVPLLLLGGMASGALWGMLAGFLKVRFQASEIVTTIMLNFVAVIATGYLVTGPLIEEVGKFPQSAPIGENAELMRILLPTRLHFGFIVALCCAFLLYLLLLKSNRGFAIRAVGLNPEAARYAGINVERHILLAMAISGGMAGLAGAVEVAGLTHRLYQAISPGYGFDGIAVALLVNNHPLGCIFSGLLFGALRSGSEMMQMNAQIPSVIVSVIQGLVLLTAAAMGVFRLTRRYQEGDGNF